MQSERDQLSTCPPCIGTMFLRLVPGLSHNLLIYIEIAFMLETVSRPGERRGFREASNVVDLHPHVDKRLSTPTGPRDAGNASDWRREKRADFLRIDTRG